MFQSLKNQLIRDLQASWQKTALLGGLFLLGLCFWLPPLWRAVFSKPGSAGRSAAASHAGKVPGPAVATTGAVSVETSTRSLAGWQQIDEFLDTDPLVRSVEVAALRSDPFRLDADQFPPPVLFADDQQDESRSASASRVAISADRDAQGLVLKSTIVGVSRRAAYINRKLYYEGSELVVNGETYHLAAVHPRKVVLHRGDAVIELNLPHPATERMQVQPD